MPIPEEDFIETDPKWREGVVLNFYDNKISVMQCTRTEGGKIYNRKVFASKGNGTPAKTSIPLKVNLGFPEDAFRILMELAAMLRQKHPELTAKPGDPVPRPLERPHDTEDDYSEPPF
jgi:hypothetical protein